jgi:glycine cleavage system regulatory protein
VRTSLVISFIGDDRPGLVEQFSEVVSRHDGNWLESRMSQLAGKFAGIVRVGVASTQVSDLSAELKGLASPELSVLVEESKASIPQAAVKLIQLSILGLDRPGIVKEIAQALAQNSINVIEMTTDITNAPMTGELLFNADAWVHAPETADLEAIQSLLEATADELAVDIEIQIDE